MSLKIYFSKITNKLNYGLLITLFIAYSKICSANNVNILTWENMFDASRSVREKIQKIEKKCNTNIYFDKYTNNTDFLEQLQRHNYSYDIVVAPNTFLNLIAAYIPGKQNPNLKKITEGYNPLVRKHFRNLALPPNTVYFVQSLTGLLINIEKIQSNEINNIQDLIQKLDSEMILLVLDDPIEISAIMERSRKHNNHLNADFEKIIYNIKEFSKISGTKNVTIVNFYNDRMSKENFAAAISWSGDAIVDLNRLNKNSSKYTFVTPKNLSFISSDLLVQLNRKSITDCVMNNLSEKEFLDDVAYQTNYFSPFLVYNNLRFKNNSYYDIQKKYLDYLAYANWLDSISNSNFDKVQYEWEKYKFNTIRQKNKNTKH